jgi:hypothetical protein
MRGLITTRNLRYVSLSVERREQFYCIQSKICTNYHLYESHALKADANGQYGLISGGGSFSEDAVRIYRTSNVIYRTSNVRLELF